MNIVREIWYPYLNDLQINHHTSEQEFSSRKTSRKQIPRTAHILKHSNLIKNGTVMLDLGCGKFKELMHEFVRSFGGLYYGVDPYNVSHLENLESLSACAGGKSDVVTISNVLNVIKEESIQSQIIHQAYDALKVGGTLVVVIYEGVKTKHEKENDEQSGVKSKMTPIITRDGYQQRKETLEYLPIIQRYFPTAQMKNISKNGGKAIIAVK
ncbi:class I SAM-dependent methyltransferase [Photobacterium damselae]|uniref:class I SAM-dependent methyltransferase n=1 Tax=Photobacterium damselae TaxID=38293 RepID=UPI001F2D33BD|nr:class I SAM-dependent methyltransferase [Photobacterium damselae]UKA05029.1 class I SAM-dependent methyltransferase [Photobacterium damselae subsp. damselae]